MFDLDRQITSSRRRSPSQLRVYHRGGASGLTAFRVSNRESIDEMALIYSTQEVEKLLSISEVS